MLRTFQMPLVFMRLPTQYFPLLARTHLGESMSLMVSVLLLLMMMMMRRRRRRMMVMLLLSVRDMAFPTTPMVLTGL